MRWSASSPALLVPVRLETRYGEGDSGPELKVRIYPDQLSVDSHEHALTDGEVKAGTRFWETVWYAGTDTKGKGIERTAWQALATSYRPQRAAWIARELTPTNLDLRPATGGAPGSAPQPAIPAPPSTSRRETSWERAPLAAALPDYWMVDAYRDGDLQHRVTSNPVRRPLAVGPTPGLAVTADPRDLQIDGPMLWMVDFDEAVDAGMGVRIPLPPEEDEHPFDRIVAIGLRSNVSSTGPMTHVPDRDPGTGGPLLSSLFDAHHYTDGLAFVPQGAPTNNTAEATSEFSRRDPGHERSFKVEREGPLNTVDGGVAAHALGLPTETFEHVAHADRTDQVNARAMAMAVWPATLGYFLRQVMDPEFTFDEEQEARTWFLSNVCARGPLPAFRVGDTPYGVLPITSLGDVASPESSSFHSGLLTFLRRARPVWQASAEGVPRVRRDKDEDGDPDADLVELLGMEASAQSLRGRHVLGDEFLNATWRYLKIGDQYVELQQAGRGLLDKYGYTALNPRVTKFSFYGQSFELSYPLVQDGALSETDGLANVDMAGTQVNYISWLRRATVDDIRNERYPGGTAPTAFLYRVLRQAVLSEYANLAFEIQIEVGSMKLDDAREPELVGFPGRGPTVTAWDALTSEAPGVTPPGMSVAEYLQAVGDEPGPATLGRAGLPESPYLARLRQLRWSLDWLAKLATAELERLLTETLDTCSHRLDAWITGVAYERVRIPREAGAPGLHVGAYGFVEDLRPAGTSAQVSGDEAAEVADLDQERAARLPQAPEPLPARDAGERNGGFIHAPSLSQAAAGAILRNGYLTHRESSDGELLAIDLSSERVRVALSLLAGIREGQSLAALLGYRFETALYRRGLGQYVEAFRNRYPVVGNKLHPSTEPAEAVAASNVVDGEALYRDWIGDAPFDWSGNLPPAGTSRTNATAAIEELRDAADALGDLSLSESVFQLVRGNYLRAGSLLDAISRGERPPDPEVVDTPRGGADVTHRLMLLATGTPSRSANWPPATAARPRAQAEPVIDAWLSGVMPRPDKVRVRVAYKDSAGAGQELGLKLSDLDVGPLDAVELAGADDQPQASELEQRILYEALQRLPAGATDPEIVFARPAAGWTADELSFPQWLVAARAARELAAGARPLRPEDLVEPERGFDADSALQDGNAELNLRAGAALDALVDAREDLEDAIAAASVAAPTTVGELRDLLFGASFFGVSGAIPPLWGTTIDANTLAELKGQAADVVAEMKRREAAVTELDSLDRTALTAPLLRDHLVALIHAVLGPSLPVAPRFRPPDADALDDAFGDSAALVASDPAAPARWLEQLAHVRQGVRRHQGLRTVSQLLGAPAPALTLGQLPYRQGDRWAGLPLAAGTPAPSGAVSLAVELATGYSKTALHAGLLLDTWAERIPSEEQTTGLSFHYDQPTNRAPQSLLLAVCPDDREDWSENLLFGIVGEAIDLAKVRMVDLDTLLEGGSITPALYFPFNADNQAVSGFAEWIG